MDFFIQQGLSSTCEKTVTKDDTAVRYGSGKVEVFATPALVALIENTCLSCVDLHLPMGYTTVGTEVSVSHLKATPVGMKVRCEVKLEKVEGKKLYFSATAFDECGIICNGTHTRYIVDVERFMENTRKCEKK